MAGVEWLGGATGLYRLDVGRRLVSMSGTPSTVQGLFEPRGSINRWCLARGSHSWHFDILDILVSLSKHLLLISIIDSSL